MAETTHYTEQIDITLNGDPRSIDAPATLASLLETLGLDPRTVVVELNREIVRRPQLADTPVRTGDSIELVHFVGGG